ncbi:Thiolase-like [Sesbania bispinosa]|nr:Thiolase-like [Sesbania bispinosa]
MASERDMFSAEIVNRGVESSGPNAGSLTFSVRVRRRLPDFSQSVNLKYVKLGYHYLINHGIYLFTIPVLLVVFSAEVGSLSKEDLWKKLGKMHVMTLPLFLLLLLSLFHFVCLLHVKPRPIYLIDFACYQPQDELALSSKEDPNVLRDRGRDLHPKTVIASTENTATMKEGRAEASMVMLELSMSFFEKTRVRPKDVGILVVNCSIFNPRLTLSNDHKPLQDEGKHIELQSWWNGLQCWDKLVWIWQGTFFKPIQIIMQWWCVYQEEDDQKLKGLKMSKDLIEIGGDALKTNITTLGPWCYPSLSSFCFFATLVWRHLFGGKSNGNSPSLKKPYIPNYKLAFEHFCVHAASKTILDELQRNLELSDKNMEASRMTLHRLATHLAVAYGMSWLTWKQKRE